MHLIMVRSLGNAGDSDRGVGIMVIIWRGSLNIGRVVVV